MITVLVYCLNISVHHLLTDTCSKSQGRNVQDFINELDNLHEYFRISFPKVQPPSFCVEDECEPSLTLHHRSTRKGFTQFVKGNKKRDGVNSRCAKWFGRATGNWFDPKP